MRILIAGATNPLGKAFIKEYKKTHKISALDFKKSDFSTFAPMREVFSSAPFDAVLYFAAEGRFGTNTGAGDLNLFKNLQYASILFGVKKMITCLDSDPAVMFNALIPELVEKDKIGTALKFYGLYGQNAWIKTNAVMRILSDANKKGAVTIANDRLISATHTEDALKVIAAFVESELPQGAYDVVPAYTAKLSDFAKSAKRVLKEVKITVENPKAPEPEYTGNPEPLKTVLPKFKFTALNAAVAKVLGDV